MTSATERLRALLDERGVEYTIDHGYREFFWDFGETGTVRASAVGTKGLVQMIVTGVTPEQAVAATLGPGTCKPIISDNLAESEGTGDAWADCSECGHLLFVLTDPNSQPPNYCPSCGRRIVGG